FDLRARSYGVPLYQLLGGGTPQLKTDITISLNDTATMVRDSLAAVAAGFDTLKVKLGTRTWRQEVDTMFAIRSAVGDGIVLRLDANQGWTPKQAVQIIDALEQAGMVLDFVEQPVKARDLAGLRFVTERVKTPVLADEAVFDLADALDILSTQSADILNIKLMKCAGISQAIDIAALARRQQIPCMIGCMLESAISVAAAAHFAVAHADVVTRVDLDGPLLCATSPVNGGLIHDGPWIRLSEAPGLGIEAVRGLQEIQTYAA
ncbi:MAG TPA: enolase C-terminal domain-like protein, partial [Usitatibacteraceae bacterium]|nr:enolase C-terminal domain-like protein [Usitatibacteraceae bacterium]